MSTHKYFDGICCAVFALSLALTILLMYGRGGEAQKTFAAAGYEARLFDTGSVHTIEIIMEDWDEFIDSCTNEEYGNCTVIIDNEVYKNVALRAKGNTSLSHVKDYGNNRYSFKIEFDHYDSGSTYYGLDKLNLNNMIWDSTYMKDYLSYQMMGFLGVHAPLCSYAQILVNGEEWGLYLAVEGVEDAFLSRNYGNEGGCLYKPESMDGSMGGMRGGINGTDGGVRGGINGTDGGMRGRTNGGGEDGGNADVALRYLGDEYAGYSHIFEHAKTDITDADKDRLIASIRQLNENSNIEEVVDTEQVLRYFAVHNFVCNFDSYTGAMLHNYYLYEKDGQLSMIPWDYNLAFGGFEGGQDAVSLVNYPMDTPVSGGTIESRPMLAWIFEEEAYTGLYHSCLAEFVSQYFDSGYFEETIDGVKEMIAPYVESDPTKFYTYEEFETGADTLKTFCLLRAKSINAQLAGTIGASDQEQKADTLIDASAVIVSDMGSMSGAMGDGADRPGDGGADRPGGGFGDGGADRPGGSFPGGGGGRMPPDGGGQGDPRDEKPRHTPDLEGEGMTGENAYVR